MITFEKLEQQLKMQGLTFYNLQKDHVIGSATITRLKNEKIPVIDTRSLNAICNYLGVSPSALLTWTPDTPEELQKQRRKNANK